VAGRLPAVPAEPTGLVYRSDFVTEPEETALLTLLDEARFSAVDMRGQTARRTVLHFGLRYDYEGWRLVPTDPLPDSLLWLRDRAAALGGIEPDQVAETLVTRYPPGAGIGWHRDAPLFGPTVVGVSLGSACRLRFQRRTAQARLVHEIHLAPRSAYVLGGAARWSWQHSIPAMADLRYSVTFRTLARDARRGLGATYA
jgi:DNA oxidative demethylase